VKLIDLSSPEFLTDPYPVYRQIREMDEPYWLPNTQPIKSDGMWLFSRYDEAANILKLNGPLSKQITRVRLPEEITPLDLTMLNQDPPEHTRLRNLVKQAFTPERIKALETGIGRIADELITRMSDKETGDFIEDFALPLPLRVIADLMGVPYNDRDMFCRWITSILTGFDSVTANTEKLVRQKLAMQELASYFNQLIVYRRQQPSDDLITALIEAHDHHDKLTADELLGMCILFLVAGYETTVNLLGCGLYTLIRHPEQFRMLRQHPEYLSSAIEEMLRFESPLQRSTFRITTDTCEIGGKQLRAGEQICAMIGAANRDPSQFHQPDAFDISRTPNRHLALGMGIHICLGATLLRTEARIAFDRIIARLPNIQLATEKQEWNTTTFFRGLRTLPVYY